MADGTAPTCGRVGSRHIYFKSLSVLAERLFYPFCSLIRKNLNWIFEMGGRIQVQLYRANKEVIFFLFFSKKYLAGKNERIPLQPERKKG